ncbi:hypothetical protein [Streptomyces finlayi]|uniref:hypothetical protein n=1 Tax=Streptomyces finlayi TaxID=67296 RepID=UPI0027E4A64B|nr:hypothetical protein [Streptomyces finlayi]
MQQSKAQWIPTGVIALAVVADLVTPTEGTSAPLIMAAPVAAAPLSRSRSRLLRNRAGPARSPRRRVLDMLIRDVRRHTGGRPQDDQALLALRHSPH